MPKVTLGKAVRYPFGSRVVHHSGTVLDVSDEDGRRLREMGVVGADKPAPVTPAAPVEVPAVEDAVPPVVKPAGSKFPPLPKKTQGPNAWREYARENEIDVRGLSEKSELIGHIAKVVNDQ